MSETVYLKVGDVVRIQSSRHIMTVITLSKIGNYIPNDSVRCGWFDVNILYHEEIFPVAALKLVE